MEERIEPIFRDLFLEYKGSTPMTECNLFDGYCTFECERMSTPKIPNYSKP